MAVMHTRPAIAIAVALAAAGPARADPTRTAGAVPGAPPVVFAPGVVSGSAHDTAPAFAPDGATVYFSRSNNEWSTILVSHRHGDTWTTPTIAPFSGVWTDLEPAMSPDGTFLIFVSNRPIRPDAALLDGAWGGKVYPHDGGNLWRVERKGERFGEPVRLPDVVNTGTSIFAPAIARDGSIVFMRPDPTTDRFRLYRSALANGAYQPPVPLPFSDGTATDVDPAIAADGSYLVFGSSRAPAAGMDLFLVFRTRASWGTPIHLGAVVNAPGSDAEARLSPDGQTLYFSSERKVPIHLPLTREAAQADLERIAAWDNGQYNIWMVSLRPWLERK